MPSDQAKLPVADLGRYYYAAFVLDPDGHNVGAVCDRRPA